MSITHPLDVSSLGLGTLHASFTAITADSRQVQAGALFLAYPGAQNDGRRYIAQAIQAGVAAVVWESNDFSWHADWQVPNVGVHDLKQQVGQIAAEYYQQPSDQLTMIGVTGTNGKTSVSQWLAQCLTILGKKTAVLGTIGNGFLNQQDSLNEAANTTPDAILLQGMLADFVAQKADAVVMEVSSHGLDQGRVNGVAFDIAILTNLSRDHLDYHLSMEAYAAAKQRLFDGDSLSVAIVNADDLFGQTIIRSLKSRNKPCISYSMRHGKTTLGVDDLEIYATDLQLHDAGLTMQVTSSQGAALLNAPVLGRFNAYNILAVLATLLALDVSLDDAVAVIAKIKPVSGRMQRFGGGELPLVVIDYAHTPDALEKVLSTLREQLSGTQSRLICVFGCGGNRDAGKRPLMGAVASKLADKVVVTTDNPRSEAPLAIIEAITRGMTTNYSVELDRAQAINIAIQSASRGDIVVVAGKGHENYQEILGVKHPFDDALVAQAALKQYSSAANLGGAL